MDRWIGKVAVVTGASCGIGAAVAVDLAKAGMIVIGMARRYENIEQLKETHSDAITGELHAYKCDVSSEDEIKSAFAWVEENFGGVDVLVSNAGILRTMNLVDADNSDDIKQIANTNMLGAVFCTREAFQSMQKRNVAGHIFLMNSEIGHKVPYLVGLMPSLNMYPLTKYALTAMTEVLRQEFQTLGTMTKITSISPGAVKTELFQKEHAEKLQCMTLLDPEDVSAAVLYALGTPPHVQVHDLRLKPIGEVM